MLPVSRYHLFSVVSKWEPQLSENVTQDTSVTYLCEAGFFNILNQKEADMQSLQSFSETYKKRM